MSLKKGYQPISVSATGSGSSVKFAATFNKRSGKYQTRYNISAGQFRTDDHIRGLPPRQPAIMVRIGPSPPPKAMAPPRQSRRSNSAAPSALPAATGVEMAESPCARGGYGQADRRYSTELPDCGDDSQHEEVSARSGIRLPEDLRIAAGTRRR
ncbi:hypothetical protein ABZ897_38585 [Nonomuraea sp. NPDC046802]|uniref:hypothetical protein n=1 Tax=Nonomuraea sp. NPDC046802 TaxID=3154919 RepID=UPI0033D686D2